MELQGEQYAQLAEPLKTMAARDVHSTSLSKTKKHLTKGYAAQTSLVRNKSTYLYCWYTGRLEVP